jgi:ribosomal protein L16 Arg81 hydroxylase
MDDLEFLLKPISRETFFEEYWEKALLHIQRNDKTYYDSLITLDEILNYTSRNDLRYPAVRLVKDGLSIPLDDYTVNITLGAHEFSSLMNHDQLSGHLKQGATIQFQYLQLAFNTLQNLCKNISDRYRMHIQANAYLTPPNSQGFAAHYDTHGVFILQVFGEKVWKVYETIPFEFPLKEQRFDKEKWDTEQPAQTILLKEGDFLYIPRGMVHEAHTSNDLSSFHITMGILPTNWIDIFRELLSSMESDREFRKALPYDGSTTSIDEDLFRDQFSVLTDLVRKTTDPIQLWKKQQAKLRAKRSTSDPLRLKNIVKNEPINPDTVFSLSSNVICEIQVEEQNMHISFYNKRITFPMSVMPSVKSILESSGQFGFANLQPDLSEKSKHLLLNKLHSEGLINIVGSSKEG